MRRLYLRIYLAVLASLAAFAVVSGVLWHAFGDAGPAGRALEVAGTLAQNVLPPVGAPDGEEQAALEKLVANLRVDVALFAADRTPLAGVGQPLPAPNPGPGRGGWMRQWGSGSWAIPLPDGRWMVARLPHDHRHPGVPLFVLAIVALAVGVGAYPVVRRLTSRLERLQTGVESLGAGDLSARVKVEGRDEIARLAESFNRAAGRIEELVSAHKALLANASHELRTPLTRVRLAVELMKTGSGDRKRQVEQDIVELDTLIDEILLASRLDAVKEREANEEVDLLALAAEECARYEAVEVSGEAVAVRGDPRLLRRMVRNLLENARRHGAPPIEVQVAQAEGRVELRVCDHGPGIPDTERDRVFQPFQRFGGAGDSTGTGLGLSLVRQIARQHDGDARYLGRSQETGSCFVVTLPAYRGKTMTVTPPTHPRPSAAPEVPRPGLVRPPLVYLVSIVTGVLIQLAWPLPFLPGRLAARLGGPLMAVAIALFAYAAGTFRAAGTPVPARKPTTVIVRSGPYRFSRNPIYLAFSLLQVGLAVWVNSLWLLATLGGAVALMHCVVVPREEEYLERRFGAQYLAYKASVRRWL